MYYADQDVFGNPIQLVQQYPAFPGMDTTSMIPQPFDMSQIPMYP